MRYGVRSFVRMRHLLSLALLWCTTLAYGQEPVRWRLQRSLVSFVSDAPLERIAAENTKAAGILELDARTFAVQVPIIEFQGFNAPLQKEHFNENYLVSSTWPSASFVGRIVESIDLMVPGRYAVRAKGKLSIHGVTTERIIPCELVTTSEGVRVTSTFDLAVEEHGIRIPRVVQQKIAAVVRVTIDLVFKPQAP